MGLFQAGDHTDSLTHEVGGGDTWRYHFYQMQNGRQGFTSEKYLFSLPLNSVTFSSVLQRTGTFSANVQMSDPGVQKALANQPALHQLEERTAIYVELNGELVWGGILQQCSYDSTTYAAQLNGMDWWGYFNQGRIISWNSYYSNTEQLLIAADLINIAQGQASSSSQSPAVAAGYVSGGNVGVQLGYIPQRALAGTFASGVDITVGWAESSFKSIGQAVSDIGTGALGFDWSIDVAYQSGVPTKTYNLWYPRAGRTVQQQRQYGGAVTFDMGSASGQSYTWPSGNNQPANTMFAAGSGSGNTAIASVAADPTLWDAGWPLLENSVSYTDVTSQNVLDNLALANLDTVKYPISLPTIRYNAGSDSNQPLGSFALGDDCRLMIPPDPYFPSGYDSSGNGLGENWWRVQQITTTVNDQGKSYIEIVLGLPPVIP